MTTQLPVFSPAQLAVIAAGGGGSVVLQSQGMQSYHITNRTGATLFMISDTGALLEMISPYSTRNDNIDQPTLTIRIDVNTSQPIVPSQNYPTSAWQCLYQLSPYPTDPSNSPMALEGIMSILGTVAVSAVPSSAANAVKSYGFALGTHTIQSGAVRPAQVYSASGFMRGQLQNIAGATVYDGYLFAWIVLRGHTSLTQIPLMALSRDLPFPLPNTFSCEMLDNDTVTWPFPLNIASMLPPSDVTVDYMLYYQSSADGVNTLLTIIDGGVSLLTS